MNGSRQELQNRTMIDNLVFPDWLDQLIFNELGASYKPSGKDMTVIDWNKPELLNYLGTYFPRSYAESFCIFSSYFENHQDEIKNKEHISAFDFGSGSGGEIIGLLTALEAFDKLNEIQIVAFDGNHESLRLHEQILDAYRLRSDKTIRNRIIPLRIDDFYDMGILNNILQEQFDIIMTFKAICEFVTKQQFDKSNPYAHFISTFLPKLNVKGIMVMAEISSCNHTSQEWLPVALDNGLHALGCKIIQKNEGYNHTFHISHSQRQNDVSKIVYRIIKPQ